VTVIAAGLLDVSENFALLAVLRLAGTADDLQPQARVARVFATLKFGMIGVVLGWLALVAYPVVLTAAGRGL
jgi:hypothetical protein